MTTDPFAHRARRFWRRVIVDAAPELAEAAADLLEEHAGGGVERAAPAGGEVGADRERILGYLAEGEGADAAEARLREALAALGRRLPEALPLAVRTEPLGEEDWGAAWKEHFHPFALGPRLVVKPSWESYEPHAGEAVIEMDPGMAFGTGLHASTRLALAGIEEVFAAGPPRRVLDLGTGTGILAMACALWGAKEVTALDNDPDAVAAASANVARNGLGDRVRVAEGTLEAAAGPYDLIAANIAADVLESRAAGLAARLACGGALVLSGILAGEQEEGVLAACEAAGLAPSAARREGEWAALRLVRRDEREGGR